MTCLTQSMWACVFFFKFKLYFFSIFFYKYFLLCACAGPRVRVCGDLVRRRSNGLHPRLPQARLRHGHGAASSETAGLAAGGALEDSTWAWARVLGVDEDPEHVLRGARAWRGNLASSRRPASRARVRVTLCERRDGRESTATATRG